MFLPDVNVWLALAFNAKQEHPSAMTWFASVLAGPCIFIRQTQQSFLRLSTMTQVVGPQVCTMDTAWQCYDQLLQDSRVRFALETPAVEVAWRSFARGSQSSPKVWNDAYLAAFAVFNNWTLVTFDRGFTSYAGLRCTILT